MTTPRWLFRARLRALRRWSRYAYRWQAVPEPDQFVFVAGCYNSGNTLLHDLLAAHPQVGSMPQEGQRNTDQLLRPLDVGLGRMWALKPHLFRLTESDGADISVDKMKRQWAFMYNDAARPILLEKTPVNAARVRWLERHFRPASFLAIIRNGYAVAEGIRRRTQRPIEDAIRQWRVSNEILLGDLSHVERSLVIRYESLARDPRATLERVCVFLGLEPLDEGVFRRRFRIHRETRPIEDLNPEAIDQLSDDDIAVTNREAGELLAELGYELIERLPARAH